MEEVKVLSVRFSPFGIRVLIALEEKGVKYEYQEEYLPLNKSDLLLQMNPVYKKIPVLIHNGQPICESLIILEYIDETWGSTQLLLSKPYDRARARFWADFVDKKFQDARSRIVMSKGDLVEAKRDMLESLQVLEGALKEISAAGPLPFFNGQEFGFLDIVVVSYACWFHTCETIGNFKIPFQSDYPLLDACVKRCMERESVKKSLPPPDQVLGHVLRVRKTLLID